MNFNKKEQILEKDILTLERRLDERDLPQAGRKFLESELATKRQQLEEIIGYKTQGAIMRSKVKWYNEGERNTSYFHNLEKRHFNSKTIRNLKTDNNSWVSTDQEILHEAKMFYEALYSSIAEQNPHNECEKLFFPDDNDLKLSYNQKLSCEGPLTQAECFESLKTMEAGKSPGMDGLPAEFYKVFWNDVSPFLLASLNLSLFFHFSTKRTNNPDT